MTKTSSTEPDKASTELALGQRMTQLINGFQLSAAIGAVARLGVADVLAEGPASAADLAARLAVDALSLGRVLHVLAAAEVFEEMADGRFALTPLGELLRTDSPRSVRRAAIMWTDEWHWRPYGYLTEAIRSGEAGMRAAHGSSFWEYLADHPETAAAFNAVMSSASALRARALAQGYDFSKYECLVDVGGGEGSLVREVLRARPRLRAVVFDLPGVSEKARTLLTEEGLTERAEVVSGDFFREVPSGGDLYVLSWILHDWDDESAVRILKKCRSAMLADGRLLVIEMLLPSTDELRSAESTHLEHMAKAMDLEMLVVVGGRERTQAEYEALLNKAGFEVARTLPLALPWSVIEGVPI